MNGSPWGFGEITGSLVCSDAAGNVVVVLVTEDDTPVVVVVTDEDALVVDGAIVVGIALSSTGR